MCSVSAVAHRRSLWSSMAIAASSPKDHDHIRRTKNSFCDLKIRPDMIHVTPRAKFMDNPHNKSELIHLLSSTFWKRQITVVQCDNDADTSIVRAALAATDDSVEVRAEDADVLIMLVHHSSSTNHPLFLTTSKGFYDVRRIREALSERQRRYLLFCHAFTGTTLGAIRYMFSRKAAAGLIKPETLGCSCTAFSPCLSPNPGLDAAAEHVFGPQ
ncbi:hypothetical protein GWK47_000645 [Chionoecetes opilio]|uniref:Uncharacterized protein n=1 Tax=Chionoecetes opilio TaxID=41210 RepID=A0A8J4Y5Q1_CHIOP|nr:hypothetical protein GWK47_000645 [Chionoecetes opilio]